jgi:S1-C subfamily serine protease
MRFRCTASLKAEKLSITEGVVSRIEHSNYAHSGAYLLTCQIDAPINAGNSGGPVIQDDKIVGVAFQGLTEHLFQIHE